MAFSSVILEKNALGIRLKGWSADLGLDFLKLSI